ncbi:hypothetical protein GVN20_08335 [Runella sp. CRIBMP]|uniref:Bacteriocin n=2 Tax=Spirosomataceae TaxID=2896860 RepID=A0A369ID83_9BACT|nr:hypothetical protein [Runella sp. CRIBMP]RDB07729.1 hypothetical protein DVG78_01350 [Runella aurantiaca]
MKQVLIRFSEHVLSRSQMKSIRGGYGGMAASCSDDCGGGDNKGIECKKGSKCSAENSCCVSYDSNNNELERNCCPPIS